MKVSILNRPFCLATLLVLSMFPGYLAAQSKGHEFGRFTLQVEYIECYDDESGPYCEAVFNLMEMGKVSKGAPVTFRSPFNGEEENYKNLLTVKTTEDSWDEVMVRLTKEQAAKLQGKVFAETTVEFPTPNYCGLMSELASQAIMFSTDSQTDFFDPLQIRYYDCPSWEEEIWRRMAEEIRTHAQTTRGQLGELTITGKLFDGKNLYDAMDSCSSEHIRRFLGYVAMNPDHFYGNNSLISGSYGEWLLKGGQSPFQTKVDALRSAKRANDQAKFDAEVASMKPNEIREVIRQLLYDADKLMHKGQKEEALVPCALADMLSNQSGSYELQALTAIAGGNWELKFGDAATALGNFEKAAKLSSKIGRKLIQLEAIDGQAKCFTKLGKYSKVNKLAKKGRYLGYDVSDMSEDVVGGYVYLILADLNYQIGLGYMAEGVFEAAQGACWDALDLIENLTTSKSLYLQSEIYTLLAKADDADDSDGNQRAEYEKNAQELAEKAKATELLEQ